MSLRPINCPKCTRQFPDEFLNLPDFQPCPSCDAPVRVEIFPAFFRPIQTGNAGEVILTDSEASCFFHPQKRAVVPCAACGRFLCALCDCELNGQHYCPGCLETGKTKGKIKSLEASRTRYDNIALALTLYPLIIFYFTLICAPIALFFVIRHWNSPRGMTERSRIRLIIAGVIALLEIAGWAVLFIVIFTHKGRHG